MTKDQIQTIEKTFWNILEQHVFLLPDPMDRSSDAYLDLVNKQEYAQIKMFFSKPIRGHFLFVLPLRICQEIEANLIGEDDLDKQPSCDGAKEILNILGANILSDLFGETTGKEISIPEYSLLNEEITSDTIGVLVDGLPIYLKMVVNES